MRIEYDPETRSARVCATGRLADYDDCLEAAIDELAALGCDVTAASAAWDGGGERLRDWVEVRGVRPPVDATGERG